LARIGTQNFFKEEILPLWSVVLLVTLCGINYLGAGLRCRVLLAFDRRTHMQTMNVYFRR